MVLGILKCDETHRLLEVVCPFGLFLGRRASTKNQNGLPRIGLEMELTVRCVAMSLKKQCSWFIINSHPVQYSIPCRINMEHQFSP